jgi:lipid-binding SYLF domain-containing protein
MSAERHADLEKEDIMNNAKARTLAGVVVPALMLLSTLVAVGVRPALADDAQQAQQLVDKGRLTLESFAADANMGNGLRALLKNARGVLIYPQVIRGAFIIGAGGGSGVFLARDAKTGEWSGPAFYSMGQASWGLQAGGDASEVILVALTERGVTALLSTSAKLGVDAGIAVGPIGAGAEAATANLSADIISYSRAKGLYAGVSLEGAIVATRDDLNRAYYGRTAGPTEILVTRTARNERAASLIAAVAKAAGTGPKVATGK